MLAMVLMRKRLTLSMLRLAHPVASPQGMPDSVSSALAKPPGAHKLRRSTATGALESLAGSENFDLVDAPASFHAVVSASKDEEDQVENAEARVGYSGRTERMHRFLAREFKDSHARELSYDSLCRRQGAGECNLIASCFFELLVLRTNGVIGLQQDQP